MTSRRWWALTGTLALTTLTILPIAPGIASQADSSSWLRTGGPLGGLGYDVRMNPDNPDLMYVTDAWAGVFRSDDGGVNWIPSNEGIMARTGPSGDGIPIFSLTIDPHDPSILWSGTQGIRGIYRSGDGGLTWTEMVQGVTEVDGITFRGFTVDPRSSDIVYAAAELGSWVWAGTEMPGREFDMTGGVVYKTLDGGANWTAVWRGDNLARYIWIDPGNPDMVYVSTGIFDREAANSDPGSRTAGGVGVIRSTDAGATWAEVNEGLDNLYVGSLFLSPHDASILLAGTGSNQYYDGHGAYLSTDGAASWHRVVPDDNISAVEFTTDPSIAYAASEAAIYRSEDGGHTWRRVAGGEQGWGPPGVRAGFPIDLQADPRDPDRVFVNNYGGGNFLTLDGGRTWQTASTGYTGALVRAITTDPTTPGRVYAAARSGLFVSDDGGGAWRGLNFGAAAALEHHVVAVDPTDPLHLLAATNWSGQMMASDDGGLTWRYVGPDLGEGKAWRTIAFALADPSTVYAGSGAYHSAGGFSWDLPAAGVFASHDGGENWDEINTDLTRNAQIADLAVHPEFVGFVYAASSTDGLLRTYDGGLAWEWVGNGLPETAMVASVAFDPHAPDVQLVGYVGQGIFQTTDEGETWRRVAAGLNPEAAITDIVFDATRPGVAHAADLSSGVYRSDDRGSTWTPTSDGLTTRAVWALALTGDGNHLYAATEGAGVYRLDMAGRPPESAEPLWVLEAPVPTPEPAPPGSPVPPQSTTATDSAPTTTAAVTEGAESAFPWVVVGIGAGGAVALGAVLWWMTKSRRG